MEGTPLFCPLRRRWVKPTPEEQIRQKLVAAMIEKGGYPLSLLAAELPLAQLSEGKVPRRRLDLVCFVQAKEGGVEPFLLIECKAVALGERALRQLLGYNYFLKAPYVALANGEELLFGEWKEEKLSYSRRAELPSFEALRSLNS